jgi:antitoxin HicB
MGSLPVGGILQQSLRDVAGLRVDYAPTAQFQSGSSPVVPKYGAACRRALLIRAQISSSTGQGLASAAQRHSAALIVAALRTIFADKRNETRPSVARQRIYAVVLEPEEEGGFTVRVPAFPEIVTYGQDEREALAMAEDAIRLVIEDCTARGEPLL